MSFISGKSFFSTLSRIVVFAVILIFMDISVGAGLKYLYFHARSGKYAKLVYLMNQTDRSLIILGNSHAECHFIPSVFNDSLGLQSYNAGFLNQGLIFSTLLSREILRKSTPKVVILNSEADALYSVPESATKNEEMLDEFLPFCHDRPDIREAILKRDRWEYFRLLSRIYPYNSTLIYLLKGFIFRTDRLSDGYYPLYGNYCPVPNADVDTTTRRLNTDLKQKLAHLIMLFKDKGSKVFIVVSPTFYPVTTDSLLVSLVRKAGVPMLDYSSDKRFLSKNNLFFDDHHLNQEGAKLFSAVVAKDLKMYLQ